MNELGELFKNASHEGKVLEFYSSLDAATYEEFVNYIKFFDQFYIAEALKQLLFPLTWQHNYIQPANDDLLDYADSPVPIIFCVSPIVKDFEQFELDIKSANFMNMAVCDIDGSFTNDVKFPVIQYEKEYIRTIMNLKNEQISQFDNAFPDQNAN